MLCYSLDMFILINKKVIGDFLLFTSPLHDLQARFTFLPEKLLKFKLNNFYCSKKQ